MILKRVLCLIISITVLFSKSCLFSFGLSERDKKIIETAENLESEELEEFVESNSDLFEDGLEELKMNLLSLCFKKMNAISIGHIIETIKFDCDSIKIHSEEYLKFESAVLDLLNFSDLTDDIKNFVNSNVCQLKLFLLEEALSIQNFKNYGEEYQRLVFEIAYKLKRSEFLSRRDRAYLQGKIDQITLDEVKAKESCLVAFSKISNVKIERAKAIDVLIKSHHDDLQLILNEPYGEEILLIFASINARVQEKLSIIRAVFAGRSFKEIVKTPIGRRAMVLFSRIDDYSLKDEQTRAILTLVDYDNWDFEKIVKHRGGIYTLIQFSNFTENELQKEKSIRAVFSNLGGDFQELAMSTRGVDAILAFCKIRNENLRVEQMQAITQVIRAKGGSFKSVSLDKQGKEALLAFSDLCEDTKEKERALLALISSEKGDLDYLCKNLCVQKAILSLAKSRHDFSKGSETIILLNDLSAIRENSSPNGCQAEAVLLLAKFSSDFKQKIKLLSEVYWSDSRNIYKKELMQEAEKILFLFCTN